MKLFYYCSSCKKENSFKTKATDRFELQQERGNEISERCKYCGNITKRRINRVHAKANFMWILAGIIASVIATGFLWQLGWIAGATFSIPFLLWQATQTKASNFNKVMVSDKP